MADNERVEYDLSDIEEHTQEAPAQANRTWFTPGKSVPSDVNNPARQLEQNWPQERKVITGNPVADATSVNPDNALLHKRVIKTHRNTICDQALGTSLVVDMTGTDFNEYKDMGELEENTGYEGVVV